jgi:DivIVA domain-containing protein
MRYSLDTFHFNPHKVGQVFKQLCKERGVSQTALALKTGITYNTIGNIFAGKVQDIQFERVFKFCCALGMPMEALMLLMLKDEDIDFEDQILLYDKQADEVTPVTDVDTDQVLSIVPDTVAAVAQAVTAVESVPDTPAQAQEVRPSPAVCCTGYSREEVDALLDRVERLHQQHIADIHAQYAHERETARLYHDSTQKLLMAMVDKRGRTEELL